MDFHHHNQHRVLFLSIFHTEKTTNMTNFLPGSFMEMPKSLAAEIKALEEQLTVPKEKLKAITDHFVKELEKGTSSVAPKIQVPEAFSR